MARRFSLQKIREGVSKRAEELSNSEDANVKSRDDLPRDERRKPFTFQQEDYDRTEAPKDSMRKYWRQFETTPMVRESITSFTSQVLEPGYYLQAEDLDEEQLRDLDHWLTSSSIIEGEPGKDFRLLAKKAMIQREVRGTAMIEKAPDKNDDDKIAGLKLINPETMEAATRPGQSILLAPDDLDKYEGAPKVDENGHIIPEDDDERDPVKAAAYLQDLSETQTLFGQPVSVQDRASDADGIKIGFSRDEIIKLTRDADVGEIFGTSRIEAVSNRIEGIKQKLEDNDEAISSKAYPLWLFMFGNDDNPWESSDINEFMKAQEMSNFHPGMKQGVRGDVSVETISGEVAEIAEYLEFDIDYIMTAMPIPKWMLGSFDAQPGQIDGMAQQQDINRQINESRRELEDEFTPLIREVAQQKGVDEEAAKSLRLKIGKPDEPSTTTTPRENIIRYVPENQRTGPSSSGNIDIDTSGDGEDEPSPEEEPSTNEDIIDGSDDIETSDSEMSTRGSTVWDAHNSMEQLTIRRSTGQEELADVIHNTLVQSRENVLDKAEDMYSSSPPHAASRFESLANSVTKRAMSRGAFRDSAQPFIEERVAEATGDEESLEGSFRRSQSTRFFVQDLENATSDALDEMMRLARIQVRRGVTNNEDWQTIAQRVRDEYSDADLRQRAELMAHMELRNAEATTKLEAWESDPDVIGARLVNENASTPLTESLHGAEAFFENGDISDQWMEQTREEFLQEGFNPIPTTPPFHFNDQTEMEAIVD